MEIKPSSRNSPIPSVEPRLARPATEGASDACEFGGTEALQKALTATPDIRPEAVAEGKALVASPQYPPEKTLEGLARLFVIAFSSAKPTSENPPADSQK